MMKNVKWIGIDKQDNILAKINFILIEKMDQNYVQKCCCRLQHITFYREPPSSLKHQSCGWTKVFFFSKMEWAMYIFINNLLFKQWRNSAYLRYHKSDVFTRGCHVSVFRASSVQSTTQDSNSLNLFAIIFLPFVPMNSK